MIGIDPLSDTETLGVQFSPDSSGSVIVLVRSTLSPDHACPYCGGSRSPNGTRTVRFRDVPHEGHQVFVDFKRQRFQCRSGCGRSSLGSHHQFDDRHYVTTRLIRWISQNSTKRTFIALAKESGLDEKILRELFHAEQGRVDSYLRNSTIVAIDRVMLVGRERPAIIDVEKRRLLEIFVDVDELYLKFISLPDTGTIDQLLLNVSLAFPEVVHAFTRAQRFVGSSSVLIAGTRMIVDACHDEIVNTATKEGLSPRSAKMLFVRSQKGLQRSAQRRLNRWREIAPVLFRAHELKERFIALWNRSSRYSVQDAWSIWCKDALNQATIDFSRVVSLVEKWRTEIFSFYDQPQLRSFDEWWDTVYDKFETGRPYSFAAARTALLSGPFGTMSHDERANAGINISSLKTEAVAGDHQSDER